MRNKGSPVELEHRRVLAVERILEGYSTQEVAEFLDVDPSSVRRWYARFERNGLTGLLARPVSGRPRKLTRTQEKIVLRWLSDNPTEHGFNTELWTGARLAKLIEQEWDIVFNPRYLSDWLRNHDFSPQKPERVPRERDPEAMATWLQTDWLRIKKKRGDWQHT
jgi:transposase